MHNDWLDGTPPAINIFNDRLEIVSTGGLPYNMTKKDFFGGISRPVNEILTRIFIQLGLIEQTGYGVSVVTEQYGKEAFEFLDNFLRVTIPFNYKMEETTTQKTTQKTEEKLIELLKSNPYLTRMELSKELGITEDGVKYHLNKLKKNNIIKKIGSDKSGYWEIVEE